MTAMTFFGRGGEEKCLDTGENTVLLHVLRDLGDISLLLNLITPRAVCATTSPPPSLLPFFHPVSVLSSWRRLALARR